MKRSKKTSKLEISKDKIKLFTRHIENVELWFESVPCNTSKCENGESQQCHKSCRAWKSWQSLRPSK
jgi:hypothetical protein